MVSKYTFKKVSRHYCEKTLSTKLPLILALFPASVKIYLKVSGPANPFSNNYYLQWNARFKTQEQVQNVLSQRIARWVSTFSWFKPDQSLSLSRVSLFLSSNVTTGTPCFWSVRSLDSRSTCLLRKDSRLYSYRRGRTQTPQLFNLLPQPQGQTSDFRHQAKVVLVV